MDISRINRKPRRLLEAQQTIAALIKKIEELQELAFVDELTKLMKGSPATDRLDRELGEMYSEKRAARKGVESVAVIAIDLIGFKAINDKQSHEAGDKVLIAAAKTMTSAVRKNDVVIRLHGDEFVVILWNINLTNATRVVNHILKGIRKIPGVNARIGCVLWDRVHHRLPTAATLFQQADEAERAIRRGEASNPNFIKYHHPEPQSSTT